MNAVQFETKVKETFLKYFPNGFIGANKFALNGGMYWKAGLIGNTKDCSSGYRENDPLQITFGIHDNIKYQSESEIQGKLVLEFMSATFYTKPEPGSYLAMQRNKVPSRKINNIPEKVLSTLDKYFKETKELIKIQADNNNIYGQERIPEKYLEL